MVIQKPNSSWQQVPGTLFFHFVFGSRHLILVVDLPLYESWVVADAYKVTVFYGIGSDDEFFYNSIFVLGPKGDCLKVKSCGQNKEVDKIKASGATGT